MFDVEFLRLRGVESLIHFTPLDNLESIITNGLQSPDDLRRLGISATENDSLRYDGTDHVNLSITNPNIRLLYAFRKEHPERTYAILELDPALLDECEHAYSSTNAASNASERVNVEELFQGGGVHVLGTSRAIGPLTTKQKYWYSTA